ncbi:MAG: hypothetical protein JOZ69_04060, partial [Myxococcales bacterium]|nr:hypothetical protein [Myxococcales bacterium]
MRAALRRSRHGKLAALAAPVGALAACLAAPARAADMDLTPERLFSTPAGAPAGLTCRDVAGGLTGGGAQAFLDSHPGLDPNSASCSPNNVAWANLMSELGYAIAPGAFHPARSGGYGGFVLTLEATFAHVNAGAVDATGTAYWHAGTRGP